MLSGETVEQAQGFARWKRSDEVDNSLKCEKCGKHYDYRIYLIHKCEPVGNRDSLRG